MDKSLIIGGVTVKPGDRTTIELPLPHLYTHTEMCMPIHVAHGRKPGPRLFVCAALHGDEINGVEIIRRLVKMTALKRLRGTLIAVPIVNVYGFIHRSRYLPDRRDLNRSFPGSERGSLAGRLANQFMREIVSQCTHGIDVHTAAIHRDNLPQVRADLAHAENETMARAFGAPVILDAGLRDGSIRKAVQEQGLSMIVYEAGEALRFEPLAIHAGVRGILSIMRALGMLPMRSSRSITPVVARSSQWVRAPQSGILRLITPLGARVRKNDTLGVVADPFGLNEAVVSAPVSGIVIGRVNLPLVNEGEALVHIARFADTTTAEATLEAFREEQAPEENQEGALAEEFLD